MFNNSNKFRGGQRLDPEIWNTFITRFEAMINGLGSDNFKKDAALTAAKFTTALLRRLDVSAMGGESKVLEHNNDSDISMVTAAPNNTIRLFTSDADTYWEMDFLNDNQIFVVDGVSVVRLDAAGWADLIP